MAPDLVSPVDAPEAYRQMLLGLLGEDDPALVQAATVARLRALVREAGPLVRTRPAPEEWSVVECLGHLADGELVVARAGALDPRRGRARHRRLRPGSLGRRAAPRRGRPGGPHRPVRRAAHGQPAAVGPDAGGRPAAGRSPPRAWPGELRADHPPGGRPRPLPRRPGGTGLLGPAAGRTGPLAAATSQHPVGRPCAVPPVHALAAHASTRRCPGWAPATVES